MISCPYSTTSPQVKPAAAAASVEFVAISRFVVANGMEAEVREAFRNRPHRVDGADGFVRMDVLSPQSQPAEFWLVTYWTEERHFRAWHRSHEYHESHADIPSGLKLVPGETRITHFEHICS